MKTREEASRTAPALEEHESRPLLIDASLESACLEGTAWIREGCLRPGFDVYSVSVALDSTGQLIIVPGRDQSLTLTPRAQMKKLNAVGATGQVPLRSISLESVLQVSSPSQLQIDLADSSPQAMSALRQLINARPPRHTVCIGSRFDAVAEQLALEFPEHTHFFPRIALAQWCLRALLEQTFATSPLYRVLNLPMRFEGLNLVTPDFIVSAKKAGFVLNVRAPAYRDDLAELYSLRVDGIIFDETTSPLSLTAPSAASRRLIRAVI